MKKYLVLSAFVLVLIAPHTTRAAATVIYLTSGSTWTVPSDWNSSNNTIEVIGGGGIGRTQTIQNGGAGGAYSESSNVSLTPGATVGIHVGLGGHAGVTNIGGDTYLCNSTSNCTSLSDTAVVVSAQGGGSSPTVGVTSTGGAASSGIGTTLRYSGGSGGSVVYRSSGGGGGGGGAGGPKGNGAAGANENGNGADAGAGGGGGGGGSAGTTNSTGTGGTGGNNYLGSGGGASASGAGSNGGGGGGGNYAFGTGGVGGAGSEWSSYGAGGGGGGGAGTTAAGGSAGLYGGGGGGSGGSGTVGGSGAQGIIVVTYTPAPSGPPAGSTALSGWAWSSNVGWLSFNSTDSGAGGGAAYDVYISTTSASGIVTGAFGGYAWSPNIGWVSFNASDLAVAPACPGGSASAAKVVLIDPSDITTGTVTGYARAVSGIGSTIWDGCIQLSDNGSTPFYHDSPHTTGAKGVTYQTSGTTGMFNGFAWDSGVLGWLSFAPAFDINGVTCSNDCGGPAGGNPSSLALNCTSSLNGSSQAVWTATASGGTSPYTITWSNSTPGVGTSSGTNPSTFTQTNPLSAGGTATVAVSVTDSASNTANGSCSPVTVAANPASGLGLYIAPGSTPPPAWNSQSATVKKGNPFILGWTINLSSDYSCQPAANSNWPTWGANIQSNSSVQSGNSGSQSTSSVSPGSYSFTINCSSSTTNPVVSSTATLLITNSVEGEI